MTEERARRKLSGILSADAVGYSRLMQEDEASTIITLAESKELMANLIQQYGGRVVDAPGDNLLAEFGSVVDASECAVKIQQELKAKNAKVPDNRKMEFRIGVNLGDVVEEADRIYGDGVNIAARLEALAVPGGICISRTAFDHVKNKLNLGYEYLGERSVKNIAEPVRVYRVLMESEAAGKVIGEKKFLGRISRKTSIGAIIILLMVAGGVIGWNIYLHQTKKIEPASMDKMAYPIPDKPSIAVLPFDNLSGDPEQDYFIDGLSQEIITTLSKVPGLFVIARNSSFKYKGKTVKVQQVSEELGVRYVLEGSVRKSGNQLRITTQLIDAITGRHLWAERYNRQLKDIFVIQDEITIKILSALRIKLKGGQWVPESGTDNLQAYMKILEATGYFYESKYTEAMKHFDEARTLDPQWANTYAWLSVMHLMNAWFGPSEKKAQSLKKAFELAQECKALDDKLEVCPRVLGHVYLLKKDYDKAISEGKIAVELNPNSPTSSAVLSMTLRSVGRHEDALRELERARRLDPNDNRSTIYHLCATYNLIRRYEEAIAACNKVVEIYPKNVSAYIQLATAYSSLERMDEARTAAFEIEKIDPNFSVEHFAKALPYKRKADIDLLVNGLRKAGLK